MRIALEELDHGPLGSNPNSPLSIFPSPFVLPKIMVVPLR